MAKKCRHRKGIILASVVDVGFTPDQEPFTAGVIESCGISEIVVGAIDIHFCPKCKVIQDITVDGDCETYDD